ncbi:tetrahydrodipicolinate N-succinyltransferase N-terminal domain-containing protein [Campylobacter fetus]|uniref:tetrahydrodipicolinate N-succinyltransferase N-terminal domain-containing protein n=1 Tax=Campylobacter fetus TaxID=196 RepID=UPI0003C2896F|nr:tetrahydrodipicolinate N-succinyltransferase N-terminal domain-containing protein [Campylobacter fetus]AGZ81308.1 tetrahydrodipicolinate succinylase [Campylobacter fetus subsp. testudinum 03-427]AJB45061.1 2,3,4,5-tetrahydropyridine-2,6-carboxylate N-succinyltransferase [Campylobacter fetus subsp. testudinum]EAI4321707.1 2,3,4,5-tetrahydropyridine-2,6-carboxylate N-succinyltransferase [Campylobacter fetus]EAI4391561.1 2,3,4,5-tetrahydropyridine-2,6-carboxylate N-succinyltransferase [Campylob
MSIKNQDELKKFTDEIRSKSGYKDPFAFAIGRVQKGKGGKTISVNYSVVNFKENYGSAAVLTWAIEKNGLKIDFSGTEFVVPLTAPAISDALEIFDFLVPQSEGDKHRNIQNLLVLDEILNEENGSESEFVVTFIYEDAAPKSIESVYLKLYLLSLNKVEIRGINLNGAFGILPNLAWDAHSQPYELDYLRENEIWLKMKGWYPSIVSVDKFPRYLSHIIPADNTRILDSAKVRMGAQLAAGTTVMPGAAYINFNSGTTGAVMVEGRVSSSVSVGDGSDVGGGASILGVLSGTNGNAISVGKKCLLGANSVTGVPLGDDCIVDAGVAILEGTKVFIDEKNRDELAKINPDFKFEKEIYKALELAGLNGLHYRQNSQNGQITAGISKRAIKLNADLH